MSSLLQVWHQAIEIWLLLFFFFSVDAKNEEVEEEA